VPHERMSKFGRLVSITCECSKSAMKSIEGNLIRNRRSASWWLAGIVFVALNILLRFAINQPPVWDGAMTVYPAAIELSRTDFDFARLFSLPNYSEGGPKSHATSPWTVMVAVLISTTGSLANALPILHVVSFGLAALTVAAAYRLIAHSAPGIIAVLGAIAVLLFPPMIVQTTDIYLDLPLTCLGTWGLVMLLERKFLTASALITLAVWIKPLAVIFAAVLMGFVLIYGERTRRVIRGIVLATPPLIAAAVVSVLEAQQSPRPPFVERYLLAVVETGYFLTSMPDLVAIVGVAVVLTVVGIKEAIPSEASRVMSLALTSALAFVLLNSIVSMGIPLLSRYYIALVPALIAGILTFLSSRSRLIAFVGVSVLILAFAVNLNGVFYSYKDYPFYALAERSLAYRDLLALQIEDVSLLTKLSDEMPVYYDYFGFYRLEYPELGYAEGPLPSGVSVFHNRQLADATLADLPQRFAFMFEYPILGGEVLLRIWNEAKESGAEVTETALTRGPYTVYVVEVNQAPAVSP